MDLFNTVSNLFIKEDETGYKNLVEERNKTKENFKKQLKQQLFMTDAEAAIVIGVIEEFESKRDEIQGNFDSNDHSIEQAEMMNKKLTILQNQMEEELKMAIKAVMQEKLKYAKQVLKNRGNGTPPKAE